MKKKMVRGGNNYDPNVLDAGSQATCGAVMRSYIAAQIFIPPVDEEIAWENNEDE